MNVLLFGATGMVGQGVLRECLLDPGVERVVAIGRAPTGETHAKLREVVRADLFDVASYRDELGGHDACFFCLGVSSAGMKEEDYHRITHDLTLAIAREIAARDPRTTFIYVSGAGTDGSEKGRSMWARVKGKTENALLALPFERAFMFRPAVIQPRHGARSKTRLYRALYVVAAPLFPLLRLLAPAYVTTTENVGKAMLRVAREGADARVLENRDIDARARFTS